MPIGSLEETICPSSYETVTEPVSVDVLDDDEAAGRSVTRKYFKEWTAEDADISASSQKRTSATEADSLDTNEPVTFQRLHRLEDMYYDVDVQEHPNADDKTAVKRQVKKIYRNVKFFSDTGHEFDEPSFAYAMLSAPNGADADLKKQTVQIAEILMKLKEPSRTFSLKTKIFWWKGYRDIVRKELNRLRQAEVRALQTRFVEGMFFSIVVFC